jgi:nitrogen fixation protein NifU and related proteins
VSDFYREVILDHYKNPRGHGAMESPDATAEGLNPLCGDEVTVELLVDGDRVADVAYKGSGCSISQSSASMMTEAINGKPLDEVKSLSEAFTAMMRGEENVDPESLGDLEALSGVRKFPVRVKCATLAWHTLEEVLDELGGTSA